MALALISRGGKIIRRALSRRRAIKRLKFVKSGLGRSLFNQLKRSKYQYGGRLAKQTPKMYRRAVVNDKETLGWLYGLKQK